MLLYSVLCLQYASLQCTVFTICYFTVYCVNNMLVYSVLCLQYATLQCTGFTICYFTVYCVYNMLVYSLLCLQCASVCKCLLLFSYPYNNGFSFESLLGDTKISK